ncbi:MBL fold metallo-hydrolase [Candidatus Berkelbacteria bacterium]|nr:MBL fold metallo-hydrolase [Candidatus Berkelbacteria bacterium]
MTRARAPSIAWFIATAVLVVGLLVQVLEQPEAANGLLRVRVLDVGQGDAILVDTPSGEHLLVDGGPDDSVLVGLSRFLAPPPTLTLVVATHNDADHIGGLPAVLETYPVTEVWITGAIHTTETFERWLRAIPGSGARTTVVQAGHEATFGEARLRVLHPFEDFTGVRPDENHQTTIVLKLTYGATSFLLTGDLGFEQEALMIERAPELLGATVLKVTHHGSQYGTSERFLEYVHPELAVVSVGADNRYDHPTPELLERLSAVGLDPYRTDKNGTVTFRSDGTTIEVETEHP